MAGKVSVITPIYNIVENGRVFKLKQCIESVSYQNYPYIQHIIVDGDSKDGTKQLLIEYKAKMNITFLSEKDKGIYDAMNKGIRLSDGEYVIFLNSDDRYVDENVISDLVSKLEEQDSDMVFANARYIDSSGTIHPEFGQVNADIRNLFRFMPFCHQTLLCKSTLFETHLFNEQNKSASDYEWVLETFFKGVKWDFLNREVVEFSLGGMSDLLRNRKTIRKETINAFYKVLNGLDSTINKKDCQLIYDQYYMPKRLYDSINKHLGITLQQCENLRTIKCEDYYDAVYRSNVLLDAMQRYALCLGQDKWIGDSIKKSGIRDCYIYGYGRLGRLMAKDFVHSNINVYGIIDRYNKGVYDGIKVSWVDDGIDKTIPVIVTVIYEFYEIRSELEKMGFSQIVSIDDYLW